MEKFINRVFAKFIHRVFAKFINRVFAISNLWLKKKQQVSKSVEIDEHHKPKADQPTNKSMLKIKNKDSKTYS